MTAAPKFIRIPAQTPQEAVMVLLGTLPRSDVEGAIDALLERLDALDGDPDNEGIDEREPDDDAMGDISWPEWHTRGRIKVAERIFGAHEPMARHYDVGLAHEDDEDDDPLESNGDEHDTGNAEDDELTASAQHWGDHWNWRAAGCPISDAGGGYDEEDSGGHCPTFGIDQTRETSEGEAFHDLNGIPLIRVPAPENDQ